MLEPSELIEVYLNFITYTLGFSFIYNTAKYILIEAGKYMKIVVTGVKGGVGKSTIAYSILKEIIDQEQDKKIVFIDIDNVFTVSNLLGVTEATKINNLTVIPFRYDLKDLRYLEESRKEADIEIIDAPCQVLSYYTKIFGNMRGSDIVILVANEMPYVLTETIKYGKSIKAQYNVTNVILIVNMAKGEVKHITEFPVIRIPFNYNLLYKGVSNAPSIIKIWEDIKNFIC